MLREIMIMKPSGIIFYSQEFFKPFPNSAMIGNLVVAMLGRFDQALKKITPFYLEFRTIALSVCLMEKSLAVLVFHEPSDFPEQSQMDMVKKNVNARLGEIFLGIRKDLLIDLAWSPGIGRAFILKRQGPMTSLATSAPNDALDIEADYEQLLRTAMEIMSLSHKDETVGEITLETSGQQRLIILNVTASLILVAVVRKYT
ncbi:MAG: hypothetical protein EZS28_025728 [Streblomastix strix]|uniref:Uncharacterized protein n=1 Tax=Streblomastix strix TaxID=222440 RepID=A0A5J4V8D9_9EUKA|nr:MAG: hypothetical protein EZS28_025728 [Streblomastix strix]